MAMKGNCVYRLWQQKPLMPSHSWLVPCLIKVIMGSWDSLVIACMDEFIMIFFHNVHALFVCQHVAKERLEA